MSEKAAAKRAKKPMWLVRLFVKDYDQVQKQRVRESYGRLSGAVGIVMNLLLSASKFLVGILVRVPCPSPRTRPTTCRTRVPR